MLTTDRAEQLREARENADLRDEFIRRGWASPTELDEIGYLSHDDLDLAAEQGRLEETVSRAFGLGLLKGHAFNLKVRRGRGGQFADKPGTSVVPSVPHAGREQAKGGLVHPARLEARTPTDAERAQGVTKVLKGQHGGVKGEEFKVFDTPPVPPKGTASRVRGEGLGDRPEHMTTAQRQHDRAKRGLTRRAKEEKGQKRLARLETEQRKKLNAIDKKAGQKGSPSAVIKSIDRAEREMETQAKLRKQGQSEVGVEQAGKAEIYDEKSKKLDKRIKKLVKKAAKKGHLDEKKGNGNRQHGESGTDLSQAELHLNDAGRISQATLLAYAEEEASQPTTVERYRNPDGSYVESRKALHDRIIDGLLRQRVTKEEDPEREGEINFTGEPLRPPTDDNGVRVPPTVLFTGGGYAAGKGSVQRAIDARGEMPEGAFHLDPDEIKALLPEFQDMIGDDPEANLLVYQEAWDIAQRAQARAQELGLNIVVDGIANTSAEEVKARIQGFRDKGYENIRMVYVSVPTDVAIERAHNRARNATKDSDKRMIPEVIMRAVHRDVSATIKSVMESSDSMDATVEIWDTNVEKGEVPILTAVAKPGEGTKVIEQDRLQEILNKANEGIEGLDKQREGDMPLPENTTVTAKGRPDPEVEKQAGTKLSAACKGAADDDVKDPQPVSDAAALVKLGEEKGLPEFRDLSTSVAEALGGGVVDFSESGKDFKTEGAKIRSSGEPTVIVGPVKKLERVQKKIEADGKPDATGITDVVRGTVLVPDADSLGEAVQKLKEEIAARGKGWKIDLLKNRLADENGDRRFPENGYGDLMLIIRSPTMSYEMQVNTTPLWYEKELGEGHALYERERAILEKPDLTPADLAQVRDIQSKSRPLYDLAMNLALGTATVMA